MDGDITRDETSEGPLGLINTSGTLLPPPPASHTAERKSSGATNTGHRDVIPELARLVSGGEIPCNPGRWAMSRPGDTRPSQPRMRHARLFAYRITQRLGGACTPYQIRLSLWGKRTSSSRGGRKERLDVEAGTSRGQAMLLPLGLDWYGGRSHARVHSITIRVGNSGYFPCL